VAFEPSLDGKEKKNHLSSGRGSKLERQESRRESLFEHTHMAPTEPYAPVPAELCFLTDSSLPLFKGLNPTQAAFDHRFTGPMLLLL
jgi:hypothetical protein